LAVASKVRRTPPRDALLGRALSHLHFLPDQFLVCILPQGVWSQQGQLLVIELRGPIVAEHGTQVRPNLGLLVYQLQTGGLPRLGPCTPNKCIVMAEFSRMGLLGSGRILSFKDATMCTAQKADFLLGDCLNGPFEKASGREQTKWKLSIWTLENETSAVQTISGPDISRKSHS
jgi:hypothetical protein